MGLNPLRLLDGENLTWHQSYDSRGCVYQNLCRVRFSLSSPIYGAQSPQVTGWGKSYAAKILIYATTGVVRLVPPMCYVPLVKVPPLSSSWLISLRALVQHW